MVKSGVANVFEELAEVDGTKIFSGEAVKRVVKYVSPWTGKTKYIIKSPRKKTHVVDFIVSAVDQRVFSKMLPPSPTLRKVRKATSCMYNSVFKVTDARGELPPPASHIIYNEKPTNDGMVDLVTGNGVDVTGVIGAGNQIGVKTQAPVDNSDEVDFVVYEMNPASPDTVSDATDFGVTINHVYQELSYNYFPRSLDFAKCSPWQFLELQGKENIWYVGGSVAFESIENVLKYNLMIVDQWMPEE